MKKKTTIIIFILTLFASAKAQEYQSFFASDSTRLNVYQSCPDGITTAKCKFTSDNISVWPQSGARWTYCVTGWNGQVSGKETWGVIGDTIIDGITYEVIGMIQGQTQAQESVIITRYDNEAAYRHVNGKEYLLFKFNMEEGDVFTTFRSAGCDYSWNDSACSSVLPLKVIKKEVVNLEGIELNRYLLQDTLFPHLYGYEAEYAPVYEFVERIGVLNAYMFINNYELKDCAITSDAFDVELCEYEDDSFSYVFSDCIPSSVIDIPEVKLSVYPNPAHSFINIDIESTNYDRFLLTIYSSSGNRVLEKEILKKNTIINTKSLSCGIYQITLTPTNDYRGKVFTTHLVIQ